MAPTAPVGIGLVGVHDSIVGDDLGVCRGLGV
jgi:hypothetical protein